MAQGGEVKFVFIGGNLNSGIWHRDIYVLYRMFIEGQCTARFLYDLIAFKRPGNQNSLLTSRLR